MSLSKKIYLPIILCITLLTLTCSAQYVSASSYDSFAFVLLSQYEAELDIGDEIYLLAVTSSEKQTTWKSSNSKVASVNTYGIITAKKAGSAVITAKIKNAEASCYITVNKTNVSISQTSGAIERGETLDLTATTSNGSPVVWHSSKKSVAIIDEYGRVTGIKPGETIISAKADGTSVMCRLTVKAPTISLSKTTLQLYRGQTATLTASVSSRVAPNWKTNKKSVAIVDSSGKITAIKHGTAIVTATVDGISKTCEIIVSKPDITLNSYELTLKKGGTSSLTATVSSGNLPVWTSSNSNVVIVNSKGDITALKKGTAYVYAAEDGTKARCTIHVTE